MCIEIEEPLSLHLDAKRVGKIELKNFVVRNKSMETSFETRSVRSYKRLYPAGFKSPYDIQGDAIPY